ncbi:MAG: hypothetical protein ABIH37_01530 [archaeon]
MSDIVTVFRTKGSNYHLDRASGLWTKQPYNSELSTEKFSLIGSIDPTQNPEVFLGNEQVNGPYLCSVQMMRNRKIPGFEPSAIKGYCPLRLGVNPGEVYFQDGEFFIDPSVWEKIIEGHVGHPILEVLRPELATNQIWLPKSAIERGQSIVRDYRELHTPPKRSGPLRGLLERLGL